VDDFIDDYETLLRPANYPDGVPGHGSVVMPVSGGAYVGVLNLLGRVFMPAVDCPYRAAEREIETIRRKTPIVMLTPCRGNVGETALSWFLTAGLGGDWVTNPRTDRGRGNPARWFGLHHRPG
jgi:calcineurin-like phosphoesterase